MYINKKNYQKPDDDRKNIIDVFIQWKTAIKKDYK